MEERESTVSGSPGNTDSGSPSLVSGVIRIGPAPQGTSVTVERNFAVPASGGNGMERNFAGPASGGQGMERNFAVPASGSHGVERNFAVPATGGHGVERNFAVPASGGLGVERNFAVSPSGGHGMVAGGGVGGGSGSGGTSFVGFSGVGGGSSGDLLMGKKKRGRPKKYDMDGNMRPGYAPAVGGGGGGAVPPPPGFKILSAAGPGSDFGSSKRARGRPAAGSGNWQLLASLGELFVNTAGGDFTPHIVTVQTGEDVAGRILQFSQKGPRGICILSANGAISNVMIRQPGSAGGFLTYEGRFEILSLTGSFTISDTGGMKSRTGGMSVSLAGPDGRVIGGGVAGLLTAASPIQIVVGSFTPNSFKALKRKQHQESLMATPVSSAPPHITAPPVSSGAPHFTAPPPVSSGAPHFTAPPVSSGAPPHFTAPPVSSAPPHFTAPPPVSSAPPHFTSPAVVPVPQPVPVSTESRLPTVLPVPIQFPQEEEEDDDDDDDEEDEEEEDDDEYDNGTGTGSRQNLNEVSHYGTAQWNGLGQGSMHQRPSPDINLSADDDE